jgi:hypothetical protein
MGKRKRRENRLGKVFRLHPLREERVNFPPSLWKTSEVSEDFGSLAIADTIMASVEA